MLDLDEIATTLDTLPNALRVLLAPFDEATLTARPAPGEWCVLEVVGHLITCDTGAFRDRVETIIAGADQVPAFDAGRALDELDPMNSTIGDLLDELAAADLSACDGNRDSLSLPLWSQLSPARRRNLLYGWLRQRGMRPPSADKIARIDTEMVSAAEDRQPEILWEDGELVRYRQRLWLLAPGQRQPLNDSAIWRPDSQPLLQLGPVSIRVADGEGLVVRDSGQGLLVRAAHGGERILLRGHHRQVSELWRSAGIPPWRRQRLPLFFVGDELVAAAAIGVADGWSPALGEPAFRLLIEDSAL